MEAITEYVYGFGAVLTIIAVLIANNGRKLDAIHEALKLSHGWQEVSDQKLGHIRSQIYPFHRERFPDREL